MRLILLSYCIMGHEFIDKSIPEIMDTMKAPYNAIIPNMDGRVFWLKQPYNNIFYGIFFINLLEKVHEQILFFSEEEFLSEISISLLESVLNSQKAQEILDLQQHLGKPIATTKNNQEEYIIYKIRLQSSIPRPPIIVVIHRHGEELGISIRQVITPDNKTLPYLERIKTCDAYNMNIVDLCNRLPVPIYQTYYSQGVMKIYSEEKKDGLLIIVINTSPEGERIISLHGKKAIIEYKKEAWISQVFSA